MTDSETRLQQAEALLRHVAAVLDSNDNEHEAWLDSGADSLDLLWQIGDEVRAFVAGVDPADEPEPAIIALLKANGFEEHHTGGGCMAMTKFGAAGYIHCTDEGGVDLPTDSEWFFGVYEDDGCEAKALQYPGDFPTVEAAMRSAIEELATIDMEDAARKRGDLPRR